MNGIKCKCYKIRKMVNGHWEYSSGGAHPEWRQHGGKTWNSLGQVRNHLNLFVTLDGKNLVPEEWEVVECEVQIAPTAQHNARLLAQRHAVAAAEQQARWSAGRTSIVEREKAELARLLAKYGRP